MSDEEEYDDDSFYKDFKHDIEEFRTAGENDRSLGTTYQTCAALENFKVLQPSSDDDTADEIEVFSLLEDEKLPGHSISSGGASTSPEANNVLETVLYHGNKPQISRSQLKEPFRLKETKLPVARPKTTLATKKFISKSQGSLITVSGSSKTDYSHVQSKVRQYIDDMKAKDRKNTPRASYSRDNSTLQPSDLSLQVLQAQPLLEKLKQARETIRLQQDEYCRVLRENSQLRNLVEELRMQLQQDRNPTTATKEHEVKPPWNPRHFESRTASLSSLSSSEAASMLEKSGQETPYQAARKQDRQASKIPANKESSTHDQKESVTDEESSSTSYMKLPAMSGSGSALKDVASREKLCDDAAVQTEKQFSQEDKAVSASSLEKMTEGSATPERHRNLQKVSNRKPTPYTFCKRVAYIDLTDDDGEESPLKMEEATTKVKKSEATQTKAKLTHSTNTVQKVMLLEKLREAAWIAAQLRLKAEHLYCNYNN